MIKAKPHNTKIVKRKITANAGSSLLSNLVERVLDASRPVKIILFGSTARDDMNANSDIDILVIVPDNVHRRRTAQNIYKSLSGFGFATDVVVATSGDIAKYKDNFSMVFHSALNEGREIYNASK